MSEPLALFVNALKAAADALLFICDPISSLIHLLPFSSPCHSFINDVLLIWGASGGPSPQGDAGGALSPCPNILIFTLTVPEIRCFNHLGTVVCTVWGEFASWDNNISFFHVRQGTPSSRDAFGNESPSRTPSRSSTGWENGMIFLLFFALWAGPAWNNPRGRFCARNSTPSLLWKAGEDLDQTVGKLYGLPWSGRLYGYGLYGYYGLPVWPGPWWIHQKLFLFCILFCRNTFIPISLLRVSLCRFAFAFRGDFPPPVTQWWISWKSHKAEGAAETWEKSLAGSVPRDVCPSLNPLAPNNF